jgi:mannose-6-phosphate isomerase-like protein (cupin superfamily)
MNSINWRKVLSAENEEGYNTNIEKDTLENESFRKVLYTGSNLQLVLMSLQPQEDIGEEIHSDVDQFFRFEKGNGKCVINEKEYEVTDGDVIIIPAGAKHNIINTGREELKLYTLYGPPKHKDKVEFKTKEEALKAEKEGKD